MPNEPEIRGAGFHPICNQSWLKWFTAEAETMSMETFERVACTLVKYSMSLLRESNNDPAGRNTHYDLIVRVWHYTRGKTAMLRIKVLLEGIIQAHLETAGRCGSRDVVFFFLNHEYAPQMLRSNGLRMVLWEASSQVGQQSYFMDMLAQLLPKQTSTPFNVSSN